MKKRKLLILLGLGIMTLPMAACTSFAPVYGGAALGDASALRFNFARPDNRLEQLILDRLKLAFPGAAQPDDPVLDVSAAARSLPGAVSDAFQVARPVNIRIEATVTISRADQVLFSETRFADTAYQGGKLTPVDIASSRGAEERATLSAAEALRLAILSSYRVAR